jgi:hypothetical protein
MTFEHLKVGDMVTYVLEGKPCKIKVTERTEHQVVSGGWKFDATTGKQLDQTWETCNDWSLPVELGYLVKE